MGLSASESQYEIRFERASRNIGAWVRGVPLDAEGEAVETKLRRALAEYGVLFFDFGHLLTSDDFSSFAQLFGEVEAGYAQKKKADPAADSVPYIDESRTPMEKFRTDYWHHDGLPLELPPLAALLTPLEVPEIGGDTMWASMYAAWDALSPRYQRLLDGIDALNSNFRLPFLEPKQHVHPAVVTDPITGRKALYVNANYTERLIGLTDKEGDAVLRFLAEHVNSPEFHVRLRWQPGHVAVWHQRVTQHRGVSDVEGPRKLKRLTIIGDTPQA